MLIDLARDRLAEALLRARRLVRRAPKVPNVWDALAYTLEQLGQWPEAVKAHERLQALDPDRAPTRLAVALETLGRIDEATGIYRRLTSNDATRPAGLIGLARLAPGALTAEEREAHRARGRPTARSRRGLPRRTRQGAALEAAGAF